MSQQAKDTHAKRPAAGLMQRIPSCRGRQNSAQSLLQETRNRPSSSASNKATASNSVHGAKADEEKVAGQIERGANDAKTPMKELVTANRETLTEEDSRTNDDVRGTLTVGCRDVDKSMKKEGIDSTSSKNRQDRPRSMSISTRGNGKTSKTSTPTQGSFTESQGTSLTRNVRSWRHNLRQRKAMTMRTMITRSQGTATAIESAMARWSPVTWITAPESGFS
ncbi:MAG: hypothetical protein Q9201_005898 [Fulgogasparrea decipioides]